MAWTLDLERLSWALETKMVTLGLTTREAAVQIDVSTATVSRVMRAGTPDVASLLKICGWLGLTVDAFVDKGTKRNGRDGNKTKVRKVRRSGSSPEGNH